MKLVSLPDYRIILIPIAILLNGCGNSHNREIARQKANTLLTEIGSGNAEREFPQKYFSQSQVAQIESVLKDSCNIKNGSGNLIMEKEQTTTKGLHIFVFYYNYHMSCGGYQLAITYTADEPIELAGFAFGKLNRN